MPSYYEPETATSPMISHTYSLSFMPMPEEGASVHELDFGGGHKVFTFVIWALEGRGKGHQ
jgi:hypothetical protein